MIKTGAEVSILLVEDELEMRNFLQYALVREGYQVECVDDGEAALEFLAQCSGAVSLIVLDLLMPRKGGVETLREIRRDYGNVPVLVLSGASAPGMVVEAMKAGATDFLPKPVSHGDLERTVRQMLEEPSEPSRKVDDSATSLLKQTGFVSKSRWMSRVESVMKQVGPCDAPVLIQGETGVGKEVLAQMIHLRSLRAGKPFLKLNCAALPSELVESELFGYERGAFTGAFRSKPGKFDLADRGTILLDEIGDMDFRLQAKLLQVVQDGGFERLGGREAVRVQVRILAATHCDLEQAIRDGRFREDLYHRLNVIGIRIPPLRERTDEILPLVELFIDKYASGRKPPLGPDLIRALMAYKWPGNIRELENFVRKYCVFQSAEMAIDELQSRMEKRPQVAAAHSEPVSAAQSPKPGTLESVSEAQKRIEIETILHALNASHWNRKQAASLLRVDYKALLYKMKKLRIDDSTSRPDQAA